MSIAQQFTAAPPVPVPAAHPTKTNPAPPEPAYAAFLGVDWGDQKHAWCLLPAGAQHRERGQVAHTPEAVEAWVGALCARFGDQPIAVALEQSRGALVCMLDKYAALHLYPVHPNTSAQFRAALRPSGAINDGSDADLLLDLLCRHRDRLRRLQPDTEEIRLLQLLVERRRQWVDERTRVSNRLTAKLKLYFPQALTWLGPLDTEAAGAFLQRWPTLEAVRCARPESVRRLFYAHHSRSSRRIERCLREIPAALAATHDGAVIAAAVASVGTELRLMKTLRESIAAVAKQIAQLAQQQPDYALFQSLPGAGAALAPRLLAAWGSRRERFGAAREMQCYSGIAPVEERSGKHGWVHFRRACPKFVRQTFQEWAQHSVGASAWARAYYEQQRAHNKDHHAAVRALAFKWIRILFRCWQDGRPYAEATYQEALRRRGSPLAAALGKVD